MRLFFVCLLLPFRWGGLSAERKRCLCRMNRLDEPCCDRRINGRALRACCETGGPAGTRCRRHCLSLDNQIEWRDLTKEFTFLFFPFLQCNISCFFRLPPSDVNAIKKARAFLRLNGSTLIPVLHVGRLFFLVYVIVSTISPLHFPFYSSACLH